MGTKYSSQSASGYNTSPPADDGTVSASNKITWATIKSKLPDPLKTFIEAINTQLVTALDYSPTAQSAPYTTVAADHQRPIEVTGTTTISLGDAATMGVGYQVTIFNKGTNAVTVALITGANTLDGVAAGTVALAPKQAQSFAVNQAANGYNTLSSGNYGFSTGDVKLTLKTVADAGWVLMNDTTIGDASSGATGRANADTSALFTLLWNNTANADCAVSSGRGANAAADYAAHKTIALPKSLGRALATYGAGAGLTSRALASVVGVETVTLTAANIPPLSAATVPPFGGGNAGPYKDPTDFHTSAGLETVNAGSPTTPINNMEPTLFLNTMIKL